MCITNLYKWSKILCKFHVVYFENRYLPIFSYSVKVLYRLLNSIIPTAISVLPCDYAACSPFTSSLDRFGRAGTQPYHSICSVIIMCTHSCLSICLFVLNACVSLTQGLAIKLTRRLLLPCPSLHGVKSGPKRNMASSIQWAAPKELDFSEENLRFL